MDRMTLHEAQTVVATHATQAFVVPDDVPWDAPLAFALDCHRAAGGDSDPASVALRTIGDALLAYHAHTVFEAGRQFSDESAVLHLRRAAFFLRAKPEIAEALAAAAGEIRDGLHYAEEAHQ